MFAARALLLTIGLGKLVGAVTVDWTTITNSRGDRLPDFSFCGYHAQDDPLPSDTNTPSITLSAGSGDQTSRIQAALDQAAAAGGGAVLLNAGTFQISPGLQLASNVVLRGSGTAQTTLALSRLIAGTSVITLGNGTTGNKAVTSTATNIVNSYVGIGANTVTVADATGFKIGQRVYVQRSVTEQWVRQNGMADLVRNGAPQTWIPVGTLLRQPRVIKSISKNDVTLDVPLTDSLDKKYMSPQLVAFTPPPISREMGIEHLSIKLNPTCSGVDIGNDTCIQRAILVAPWTEDSYIRTVNITGFNSFISVESNAGRITVANVGLFRNADTDNANGYPADISISGSQVLVTHSGQYGLATAKSFAVVAQAEVPGPNAVVQHVSQSTFQLIYPHQRWAHGFLADNSDAGATFTNRVTAGTGQGWAVNAGVAWNIRGPVEIESPPLGTNWGIGCTGDVSSKTNGTMIDTGSAVSPASLFAAQLKQRKGT